MKQDMSRIKELLVIWAGWYAYRLGVGYPRQSAFATERVQTSNRSTETIVEVPHDVQQLNEEIEKLPPQFKRIIALEYMHPGPQKSKAAILKMPREIFSRRVTFILELLSHRVYNN